MLKDGLVTVGIIILGIGAIASLTLLFMEIGILWELKLYEVPFVFIMSTFLIASIKYEDAMKDLFAPLIVQRFGAFIALVFGVFSLIMKILQNSF